MKRLAPAQRALLIALGIFGLIISIGFNDVFNEVNYDDRRQSAEYALQLELRGELLAKNYTVVQDTFAHYADQARLASNPVQSEWGMGACCEDGSEQVFQWWTELRFASAGTRYAMLKHLQDNDYVRLSRMQQQDQVLVGVASVQLPIPGSEGQVLQLDQIGFNLRLAIA